MYLHLEPLKNAKRVVHFWTKMSHLICTWPYEKHGPGRPKMTGQLEAADRERLLREEALCYCWTLGMVTVRFPKM